MSKRNTQLRRHTIANLVNEQGEVSVEALSGQFETSEVTIRKDLASLEKNGQLLRRYGGAIALPKEVVSDEFSPKVSNRKLKLARAAAKLIRDHNRIVIDCGSTTAALIQQLNEKRGLVVMTNSLNVANALNELESEPTLLMTAGLGMLIPNLFKERSPSQSCALTILINSLLVPMVSTWIAAPPHSMN